MAKLLLNLRHVPDDEADDIRALLEKARLEYYETPPNFWGVSAGGIWLRHAEDLPRARELMSAYQRERGTTARAEHLAQVREGTARTLWQNVRDEPLRTGATVLGILALLAALSLPFVFFSG